MDTSSVGDPSDTNSLVGFGEGARTPARQSGYGSPGVGKATPTAAGATSASSLGHHLSAGVGGGMMARDASLTPVSAQTAAQQRTAKYIDGMAHDHQAFDAADRGPPGSSHSGGAEAAERILRERLGAEPSTVDRAMEGPDATGAQGGRELGRFYFENQ